MIRQKNNKIFYYQCMEKKGFGDENVKLVIGNRF
jgi:hypothetical protein